MSLYGLAFGLFLYEGGREGFVCYHTFQTRYIESASLLSPRNLFPRIHLSMACSRHSYTMPDLVSKGRKNETRDDDQVRPQKKKKEHPCRAY